MLTVESGVSTAEYDQDSWEKLGLVDLPMANINELRDLIGDEIDPKKGTEKFKYINFESISLEASSECIPHEVHIKPDYQERHPYCSQAEDFWSKATFGHGNIASIYTSLVSINLKDKSVSLNKEDVLTSYKFIGEQSGKVNRGDDKNWDYWLVSKPVIGLSYIDGQLHLTYLDEFDSAKLDVIHQKITQEKNGKFVSILIRQLPDYIYK